MATAPLPCPSPNSPLSEAVQLALLAMRRSDTSKAVLANLSQAGSPGPQGRDFYAAARLGLAIKNGAFHSLTPRGWFEADRIGREIAQHLGMHVVSYDLGGPGRVARASCPCGWSAFRTRAIPSYLIMLTRDGQHHLQRQVSHV